jgi:hypothetical protein
MQRETRTGGPRLPRSSRGVPARTALGLALAVFVGAREGAATTMTFAFGRATVDLRTGVVGILAVRGGMDTPTDGVDARVAACHAPNPGTLSASLDHGALRGSLAVGSGPTRRFVIPLGADAQESLVGTYLVRSRLLVAFNVGRVHGDVEYRAYDLATLAPVWTLRTGQRASTCRDVDGRRIAVDVADGLAVLDSETGRVEHPRIALPGWSDARDRVALAGSATRWIAVWGDRLAVVDVSAGRVVWRQRLPPGETAVGTHGDRVVVAWAGPRGRADAAAAPRFRLSTFALGTGAPRRVIPLPATPPRARRVRLTTRRDGAFVVDFVASVAIGP